MPVPLTREDIVGHRIVSDFILKHQPALWVHGHIHHPVDYTLGQTRIVSNPQGYPGGEDREFKPSLTLELAD